jgi:hypothetical protein
MKNIIVITGASSGFGALAQSIWKRSPQRYPFPNHLCRTKAGLLVSEIIQVTGTTSSIQYFQ